MHPALSTIDRPRGWHWLDSSAQQAITWRTPGSSAGCWAAAVGNAEGGSDFKIA